MQGFRTRALAFACCAIVGGAATVTAQAAPPASAPPASAPPASVPPASATGSATAASNALAAGAASAGAVPPASTTPATGTTSASSAPASAASSGGTGNIESNPFFKPSTLPFGAPDFAKIKASDYVPAIEVGMRQQMAEIDKIANDPAPPTFDNTLVAMERTGRMLTRVMNVFELYTGADTTPVLQKISEEEAPKLAAHQDAIFLDQKLYDRV
ncbi:MAG: hypothetical protein ACREPL_00265 [Rhodanobacteraceae bacterium]